MVHTDKHIMDVTLDDLFANYHKKSCQEGCGVYCAVSASLLVEKPVRVLGKEILARAKRVPSLLRPLSGPGINNSTPQSITNPNGAREMNGSTKAAHPQMNRVALRESV